MFCIRFLKIVTAVSFIVFGACSGSPGKVLLSIADRNWDPNRPDPNVGWCGETCIQEAAAYFGREIPQSVINAAGHNPARHDLDYPEIDTALRVLAIRYTGWNQSNRDIDSLLGWLRGQIRQNHPVICGVKAYPNTDHGWVPDHFVLAVGFDRHGFYINTNVVGRTYISNRQLASDHPGYSFKNDQSRYFARAITGLAIP